MTDPAPTSKGSRLPTQELSEVECWALVRSRKVGRLAVSISNVPDIFPVNFLTVDQAILIRTDAGLKLAAAVLGSGVAFEVDVVDESTQTGWSVVVHGTASEIEGTEARMEAESLGLEPWIDKPNQRYVKISANKVTGRRVSSSTT